ncbi:MAG: alanine racemase [Candidatus Eisenbacteria bacterium]|nr:alanine racemase [Candidatus Eisenbacteria bacterium]
MNRVTVDLEALRQNLETIGDWMRAHGATWSVVTKVLCGHAETLEALQILGVRSIADSRLRNLRAIERIIPSFESWYLRPPHPSIIPEVVELADVSLNSEIRIIERLNEEAARLDKIHRIVIMIELGDLREGILPGSLVDFYQKVFELPNITVLGIGANLGCLAGAVPDIDQYMQLVLYRELLELKFGRQLQLISAGSSVVLPLVLKNELPKSINHFRIGESLFLGSDLVGGGTLPGLRNDVILLEAEIAEIKEKSLVPTTETAGIQPFEMNGDSQHKPGDRGYRALVTVGQLETAVEGLTPVREDYRIAGASSDITVVNLGDNPEGLHVGDTIAFRVDYAALLGLMNSPYVDKRVVPPLQDLRDAGPRDPGAGVDPVFSDLDGDGTERGE